MPSKQTFCWCFGGRPPDIKYGIDGATPPHAMALAIPMPTDENELNTKFEELVVSKLFLVFYIFHNLIALDGLHYRTA